MAELKTKKTDQSVEKFLDAVPDETKKRDSYKILTMMKEISRKEPKMWGSSMVGFGDFRYKYASGREGDWFQIGFSPRKQNLTLYLTCNINQFQSDLEKLGKYKTGVGCLYIKSLEEIDLKVLKAIIRKSVKSTN